MPIVFDEDSLSEGEVIDLDTIDLDKAAKAGAPAAPKIKPSFFHADLNGTGKTANGALHRNINPQHLNPLLDVNTVAQISELHTSHNGETKVRFIPTALMTEGMVHYAMSHGHIMSIPSEDERIELGRYMVHSKHEYVFSCSIRPQAVRLKQEGTYAAGRSTIIRYRVDIYAMAFNNGDQATYTNQFNPVSMANQPGNFAIALFTSNPYRTLFDYVSHYINAIKIDEDDFDHQMKDYNVVTEMTKQAEAWLDHGASEMIEEVLPQMASSIDAMNENDPYSAYNTIRQQMRYLETYGINLDAYRKIYDAMAQNLSEQAVVSISKVNMNLLLSGAAEQLRAALPNIPILPDIDVKVDPFFSSQQQEVIKTREPLVIVDAGAGSGKSTTLDGRLDALNQFGVPDSNILVTSFTNTAADNMKAKRPNIRSMTMASMIHEIYSYNFPNHELSSIETLANCLQIALPNSVVARDLETRLFNAQNKKGLAPFTELSAFIESNYTEIMQCLDAVQQTTLELESIICYQRIDEIIEPDTVRTDYMLIDEVQDNSVFEFIYVLKRAAKYFQQLYLVGDPSQTLYEFRNSNPKALNSMENSGIFATYKLTTNYRSNQDILNFANKFLLDIQANQFAKIQLHSNVIEQQTIDTLKERVKVHHINVPKLEDFHNNFESFVGRAMSDFVDEALARGEKTVFLALTRKHARRFQELLEQNYPGTEVSSMVPEIAYTYTAMTKYIREYWDSVTALAPDKVAFTIHTQLKTEADALMKKPNPAMIRVHNQHVDAWWTQNAMSINAWVRAAMNQAMPRHEFFEAVKNTLVHYEINTNRVRASVVSQRNKDEKEKNNNSDAPFIVSTIHSIKGLEFDNAVVVYDSKSPMAEDMKRAYYVAFTRAKKRLLAISFSKEKNPLIMTNYAILMKELADLEAELAAKAEAGTIDDDELIAAAANRDASLEEEQAQFDATGEEAASLIEGFSNSEDGMEDED